MLRFWPLPVCNDNFTLTHYSYQKVVLWKLKSLLCTAWLALFYKLVDSWNRLTSQAHNCSYSPGKCVPLIYNCT